MEDDGAMDFRDLQKLVLEWALDRGILQFGTLKGQGEKLVEEAHETLELGILAENDDEITDGIGDTMVMCIIICAMKGIDPLDCLAWSWGVIKDRKGKMGEDGKFHKEV